MKPKLKPKLKVKFCGFTRREDLTLARDWGVDYLGVIAVPASKRFVSLEAGRALLQGWDRGSSHVVLLSQNMASEHLHAYIEAWQPDVLQFHGQETPEQCRRWGLPYIKAFHIVPAFDWLSAEQAYFDAHAWLMDNGGGTGEAFDWAWAGRARSQSGQWWLAGGLTSDNVATAIQSVQPQGVDVSSGIEQAAGVKDAAKMQAFIAAARSP
jgi:phosphoribosylanthranilate isomerase